MIVLYWIACVAFYFPGVFFFWGLQNVIEVPKNERFNSWKWPWEIREVIRDIPDAYEPPCSSFDY